MELWRDFIAIHEFDCSMCEIIKIMFSIPPNTGWIERAYSHLKMVCAKRRNQMSIGTIRLLFFLSVLKLPVCSSEEYEKEIKRMQKHTKTNDIFLLKKDLKISNKALFAHLFIIVYLFILTFSHTQRDFFFYCLQLNLTVGTNELAWPWNSLPIECFPLTYNLNRFKSRINRHLLTVGSL